MQPLFRREFYVDGSPLIEAFIFEPTLQDNHTWQCTHEMNWSDDKKTYNTIGGNKLQALLLCLSRIEAQLIAEGERLGKKVTYMNDETAGLIWDNWQREL